MSDSHPLDNPELDALFERHRDNPEGFVFAPLSDGLRKAGMLEEAIEICEKGVSRHPGYASGFVVRGKCYYDIGNHDQAEASFEKVLELDGSNLVALKYMGMILAERGQASDARERFEMVLVLDPDNREIREKLAELDGLTPDPSASFADVAGDTVAEVAPGADFGAGEDAGDVEDESFVGDEITLGAGGPTPDELATMTLADIYASQGYTRKAARIYRDLLEKQPGNDEARGKLEALEARSAKADDKARDKADAGPETGDGDDGVTEAVSDAPEPAPEQKPADKAAAPPRAKRSETAPRDPAEMAQFRKWLQNLPR